MSEDPKLLGDHVEKALKKIRADKLANAYEKVTKKPCNCGKRKEYLNKLHKRMLEMHERIMKEQEEKK